MIAVTGAGGFIGHHLVQRLVMAGERVRGIDHKRPQFEESMATEFLVCDLRDHDAARIALSECDRIYHLAADMGGMGYISGQTDADVLANSQAINDAVVRSACDGKRRLFFSSSACIYPEARQAANCSEPLREDEAYPAAPDTRYGWEKLNMERRLEAASVSTGLEVRIARFHNVYGPLGTWRGGREKVPAAFCRKVAEAKRDGRDEIEVWGDGEQRRSFLYIDDCLEGIIRLMESDCSEPVNIGSTESVTINQLAHMVAGIAHHPVTLKHVKGPQGVRSRNADITKARETLGWFPLTTLEEGMRATYKWVESQVLAG